MTKNRVEINEKLKKIQQKISMEAKIFFKINKIDKSLARWTKRKKKET